MLDTENKSTDLESALQNYPKTFKITFAAKKS